MFYFIEPRLRAKRRPHANASDMVAPYDTVIHDNDHIYMPTVVYTYQRFMSGKVRARGLKPVVRG